MDILSIIIHPMTQHFSLLPYCSCSFPHTIKFSQAIVQNVIVLTFARWWLCRPCFDKTFAHWNPVILVSHIKVKWATFSLINGTMFGDIIVEGVIVWILLNKVCVLTLPTLAGRIPLVVDQDLVFEGARTLVNRVNKFDFINLVHVLDHKINTWENTG